MQIKGKVQVKLPQCHCIIIIRLCPIRGAGQYPVALLLKLESKDEDMCKHCVTNTTIGLIHTHVTCSIHVHSKQTTESMSCCRELLHETNMPQSLQQPAGSGWLWVASPNAFTHMCTCVLAPTKTIDRHACVCICPTEYLSYMYTDTTTVCIYYCTLFRKNNSWQRGQLYKTIRWMTSFMCQTLLLPKFWCVRLDWWRAVCPLYMY